MYKQVARPLHLLILVLFIILLGTCASSVYFINNETAATPDAFFTPTPAPSVSPEATFTPTTVPVMPPTATFPPAQALSVPRTTDTTQPEAGWTQLQPGLERRVIPIYNGQNQQVESLHIWRLDQKYFRLDVAYDERPKPLDRWQQETNALMVVNGGFYSVENEMYFPDGLAIVNGAASGRSFNGYGGMLAIRNSRAEVRSLLQKPYNSAEPLQAALQSFPILVAPGGGLGFGAERENNVSARRTVIGQDKDGRILFIVAPQGYFTLHQLSAYLTDSGLDLDIALNLDGGGSTGILVADPPEIISPSRPIPFVILVYPR
jgi:hypothetical protein